MGLLGIIFVLIWVFVGVNISVVRIRCLLILLGVFIQIVFDMSARVPIKWHLIGITCISIVILIFGLE